MNQAVAIRSSTPPSYAPRETWNLLAWLLSGAERKDGKAHLLPGKSLSAPNRAFLVRRRAELEEHFTPADPRAAARTIGKMLAMWPTGRASGDDAAMVLAGYVAATDGAPQWALDQAAEKFIKGRVPGVNKAFAPSAPMFAEQIAEETRLHRLELEKIETALEAEEAA